MTSPATLRCPTNNPFPAFLCCISYFFRKLPAVPQSNASSDSIFYIFSLARHLPLYWFAVVHLAILNSLSSPKFVPRWNRTCGVNFCIGEISFETSYTSRLLRTPTSFPTLMYTSAEPRICLSRSMSDSLLNIYRA